MPQTKQAAQRKRRSKVVLALGAASLSLSLVSSASAAIDGLNDACADSVEESNGKRPNLDREGLADREIGGTRSSRGEEEDCFIVTLPCAAPSSTANAAAHYSLSM